MGAIALNLNCEGQIMSFYTALDRRAAASGITRRDAAINAIDAEFGRAASDDAWSDCQEATADSAGIVRHQREADFVEQRLKALRSAIRNPKS